MLNFVNLLMKHNATIYSSQASECSSKLLTEHLVCFNEVITRLLNENYISMVTHQTNTDTLNAPRNQENHLFSLYKAQPPFSQNSHLFWR